MQTIRWFNSSDNGRELLNSSGQLQIGSVSPTLAGTMYTCEVMMAKSGVIVERTITVQVNSNDPHLLSSFV